MMRLGRRTSLFVALSLLTSAVSAPAECAWVLWFNPEADVHMVESAHSAVRSVMWHSWTCGPSSERTATRSMVEAPPATTSCSERGA